MYVPAEEVGLCTWRLRLALGLRLPNAQLSTWLPAAPLMVHDPGPVYAGVIDQFRPVPVGRGSLKEALLAVPAELLAIVMVKPIGLPAVTVAESGVVVTVTTAALAGGKATTKSLKTFVLPPMPASTFLVGSKKVVMSKTNWQKMGGFVGVPGLPICMGVLQLVP